MRSRALVRCLEHLELPARATPSEARSAFRRIARRHHPDIDESPGGRRRFIEAVQAYRRLQELGFTEHGGASQDVCERCGRVNPLLDALDGSRACCDCLLGTTRRRRSLPAPFTTTVRHLSVVALYAAGIGVFWLDSQGGGFDWTWLSLALFGLGGVTLARTCLRVASIQ